MTAIPDQMTAIGIETGNTAPSALRPETRAVPQPGAGEVLVRVAAAGVNRPDLVQRQGLYPPPPGASDIPGLEIAGEIAAIGPGVAEWQVGDAVCALVAGGGYAEYCLVPAPQCLPVPAGFSMLQAAALPETYFTVWSNLFDRGRLRPGESVLVHGGASGIGTTAVQLAKLFGATVYATAGGADKVAAVEKLGAVGIDYKSQDFAEVLKQREPNGVNLILDMVGGDYFARNIACLAVEGRLVIIATLQGMKTEANLMTIMLKRLTVTGSTLRARPVADKGAIAAALRQHVWPALAAGKLGPVIDKVFPLDQAAAAHAWLEAGRHVGKVMLSVRS